MASIRGDSGQFFGGDSGHISRCPVSPLADGSISKSGIGSSQGQKITKYFNFIIDQEQQLIKFYFQKNKNNIMPQQRAELVRLGQYKCIEKTQHLVIKKHARYELTEEVTPARESHNKIYIKIYYSSIQTPRQRIIFEVCFLKENQLIKLWDISLSVLDILDFDFTDGQHLYSKRGWPPRSRIIEACCETSLK